MTASTRDRLIGNLLDRWEMTPNDLKQEMRDYGCGKQLDELLRDVPDKLYTEADLAEAIKRARNEALEEAAKIASERHAEWTEDTRMLKRDGRMEKAAVAQTGMALGARLIYECIRAKVTP